MLLMDIVVVDGDIDVVGMVVHGDGDRNCCMICNIGVVSAVRVMLIVSMRQQPDGCNTASWTDRMMTCNIWLEQDDGHLFIYLCIYVQ